MSRVEKGAGAGGDPQKLDEVFFWENKSWSFSNSENSSEISKEKSRIKPMGESGSDENKLTQIKAEDELAQPGQEDKKTKRPACMMQGNKKGSKTGSNRGRLDEKGGKSAAGESDHEVHIWTERERRKKMRNMFSSLHDLLPQLPPKADKSTIVDEAIKQIKNLEETLEKLEKQKLDRLQSSSSYAYDHSSLVASICLPNESRESFMADHVYSNNLSITAATNPSATPLSSRHAVAFKTWSSSNLVMNVCGDEAHFSVCSIKVPGLWTNVLYVLQKHKIQVVSAHLNGDRNLCIGLIHARSEGSSDQYSQAFPSVEMFKDAATEINLMLC